MREPPRQPVPVLLEALCGGHVPPHPCRRDRRQTVPESVADHPLVFVTLTAPSFGKVHVCRGDGARCHPGRRTLARTAAARPAPPPTSPRDQFVGQPLCVDCYDYASHVVWQWWAPDLWRRFTIALRRLVAKTLGVSATRLAEVATVQYAKVAEYQLRGAIHFHALSASTDPAPTTASPPHPPRSTPTSWPSS